jgi:histidine triad (HIT) family protein
MDDCVFCRIAKGELPCEKVYDDGKFVAFLDISPVNLGHTLVVPKEHYETLLDMPADLVADMSQALKLVASMVKNGTKAEGFNLMMNNYEAAGQVVPHAHMHIVPRFKGDGLKNWQGKKADKDDLSSVKEDIVSFMQI